MVRLTCVLVFKINGLQSQTCYEKNKSDVNSFPCLLLLSLQTAEDREHGFVSQRGKNDEK